MRQYDFNYSHNKLSEKFKNCKIKYLFYEDLKFNKNIFCNQFSNFLNLDKEFTQKLFNNDPVNARKISKNKYYVMSPIIFKIIQSKVYLTLKDKIPFKNFLKEFFVNHIIYTKKNKLTNENTLRKKIKRYYKNSNLSFFKKLQINNKFNY